MSSGPVRHADKKAISGAYAGYTPVSSARTVTSTFSAKAAPGETVGPWMRSGSMTERPSRSTISRTGCGKPTSATTRTHRATVAVARDFLAGKSTQPYFAVDAADDIEATEAVIRSAQAK